MAYLIKENNNESKIIEEGNKELINNNNNNNNNTIVKIISYENNKNNDCSNKEEEKTKEKEIETKEEEKEEAIIEDKLNNKQYDTTSIQSDKICDKKQQYDKNNILSNCKDNNNTLNDESTSINFRNKNKTEYCEQFSEENKTNNNNTNECDKNNKQLVNYNIGEIINRNNNIMHDRNSIVNSSNNNIHENTVQVIRLDYDNTENNNKCETNNNNNLSTSINELSTNIHNIELSPKIDRKNEFLRISSSISNNKYTTNCYMKEMNRQSSYENKKNGNYKDSFINKNNDSLDLNEEIIENWITNNASNNFLEKLIKIKNDKIIQSNSERKNSVRNNKSTENFQKSSDFLSSSTADSNAKSVDHINNMGKTANNSTETVFTLNTDDVSNSIESVSSYNEPVNSCTDLTMRNRVSTSNKRTSVTSDLFNLWISSSPIKRCKSPNNKPRVSGEWKQQLNLMDEGDLFMELIKDISNELDIDVLCHKILVNVGLLTHADRGSLFLTKGPPENRYLVAKLFDVTVDTELEEAVQKARSEEITIPFGIGVAGTVAKTKEIINIKNAYADPRFNNEIDLRTGYKTNHILCVPINNYDGEVIGVAQIINKTDGTNCFTERDIEVFQRYLTFCGIGIQNAQLFEMSILEFERNQILLKLARSIFEEQSNLECLVTKIMTEARNLLKCERCAVFLLKTETSEECHLERILERPGRVISERKPLCRRESNNVNIEDILAHKTDDKNISFSTVFELRSQNDHASVRSPNNSICNTHSRLATIAKYVASTGQILNIGDVPSWMSQEVCEDEDDASFTTRCILCMPIFNGQKTVIGVAQLINKETHQPFTDCDVSIFEAFAIFCGLGIHNTQMYENACKLMAKQKVALECLSYHATASYDDTKKLINDTIPSAVNYNLYSFKFIDFDLSDEDTCRATIRMFLECDLVKQFHIPYDVLCRWVLSVKKNYRPVKYHNWRHALNVAQTMFAMLKTGKMDRFMSDLEILGLLVACLCHDLDHRGTNNAFQTKTESPLAILYTTSTMEHHHFDQCVMILNSDGNNIFQALSPHDYRIVMKVVENSILSTDLAMYFKKKNRFIQLVENGEFDWQSEEKKQLLCGMMMTACDVGAIAKPWEVQHKMAKLVADEFFDQGDLEKLQLNTQPVAMMDRERKDELPQMQVGFIDVICLPLYKIMSDTFPWIQPLYDGTCENRKHWQDLAEKVEMGLTWIDHDIIEKPIEEFSEAVTKDIEFTVTTLNCDKIATPDSDTSHSLGGSTTPSASSTLHYARGTRFTSLRRNKQLGKSVRNKFTRSFYHNNNHKELSNLSISHSDESGEHHITHKTAHHQSLETPPEETPETPKSPPKSKKLRTKNRTCLLF